MLIIYVFIISSNFKNLFSERCRYHRSRAKSRALRKRTYGTLAAYAGLLGLDEAQVLLKESLAEEKAVVEMLTEITPGVVMASMNNGDEQDAR